MSRKSLSSETTTIDLFRRDGISERNKTQAARILDSRSRALPDQYGAFQKEALQTLCTYRTSERRHRSVASTHLKPIIYAFGD